jgi:hypothetical protein
MYLRILLAAALSSLVTALVLCASGAATLPGKVVLDNARVKVTEVVYQPGVARQRYIRPTDQVIVFLDESRYERIDSQTKEKTIRQRKLGEVIWHNKGEDAPVLTNLGQKPLK